MSLRLTSERMVLVLVWRATVVTHEGILGEQRNMAGTKGRTRVGTEAEGERERGDVPGSMTRVLRGGTGGGGRRDGRRKREKEGFRLRG